MPYKNTSYYCEYCNEDFESLEFVIEHEKICDKTPQNNINDSLDNYIQITNYLNNQMIIPGIDKENIQRNLTKIQNIIEKKIINSYTYHICQKQ
jgi:hypothetical protein